MMTRRNPKAPFTLAIGALAVAVLAIACSSQPATQQNALPTAETTVTPASGWSALLQRTPFPYAVPLPPAASTVLDGTYVKFEPKPGTPVPCRRCPEYAPEGGWWKLHLDDGVFRVYHVATGWPSIGSFTVTGNRLALFNDPNCVDTVGTYTWTSEGGKLILQTVQDECAIGLRAINLTGRPWLSCQPPNVEAGVTDHWAKPAGCDP